MIGEILDAKYRIDKQLGAGGMGNVYLATHLGTTRVVAVKVIAPKWAAEPQFLARFQREAQACGRLRHPNIVNVTDFGIAKAAGGDMPYLVMEFLDGQTLSDFQKANPQLPLPMIADILDQIGLALAEAHRHGIIHRDLKPDNIWLEPNGRGGYTVKVLDFGVAKVNLLGDWAPPVQEIAGAERLARPRHYAWRRVGNGRDLTRRLEIRIIEESERQPEEIETVAIAAGLLPVCLPDRSTAARARKPCRAVCWELRRICRPSRRSGRKSISVPTSIAWPWWRTRWCAAQLPFTGKASELFEYHRDGSPAAARERPQDSARRIGRDSRRDSRAIPRIARPRRSHLRGGSITRWTPNFSRLRRSKAFLLQHLAAYALLLLPIYTIILTLAGLLVAFSRKADAGGRGADRAGAAGGGDSFRFFRQPAARRRGA